MGIVLLVLIPTLGVVAMALFRAGEASRDASSQRLLETAQLVAQLVDNELNATLRMMLGFAELIRYEQKNDITDVAAPFVGGTLDIYRMSPDGVISPNPGDDPERRRLIVEAASAGELRLSNIVEIDTGRQTELRLLAAVPYGADGPVVKVALLTASPHDMIRSLVRSNVSSAHVVLAITDGTGRVIGRSVDGSRFVGKPVPDWDRLVELGVDYGSFRALTIEGRAIVFSFQKISGTPGWVAVAGEQAESFDGRWTQPIYVMLAAAVITILVALGLALTLVQRILQPVSRLANRARVIADNKGSRRDGITVDVPHSFVAEFETLRVSLERAEAVTRESHAALQRAEKLARIGSWTLDLTTNHFTSSDMLYELNGADPNGPPLTSADLSRLLVPDSFQRLSKVIENCIKTGEPYALEVDHMRNDGSSFPAYIRGMALKDAEGRTVKLTGTVQDLSENVEQRERLAAVADNLPSGMIFSFEYSLDRRYRISYVSAGVEQLTGIPIHEIMSNPDCLLEAVSPEERQRIFNALEQSRQYSEILDHECRFLTREGRHIWLHIRAAIRPQHGGRAIWNGIARDITAEREGAEALRMAKEAAEAAERAKSDFLATMSHEIRTPMNTVIGMTRLALQAPQEPKQRNYLEKINASAAVLMGIINQILDFSKIEAGGFELEDSIFTLDSILESVTALTALRAEEKGLEIAFAMHPAVPMRLKGDALRLGQVLTNLVGNAIKFTERGDVLISVAPVPFAETQKDDSRFVKIQFSVRDTGVGLSEAQIKNLFRPFSQASSDTARKYGGTGLGLVISKRLVDMMGGDIRVESQLGVGSDFIFTVVLERAEGEAPVSSTFEQPAAYLRDRRILVVDDNDSARTAISEMVQGFGMVTEAVASGADALRALRARSAEGKPFDIVLLDWRMPGMDGLETARHIKSDTHLRKMPAVLMVTAYGHELVANAVEEVGLEGVIVKPVTQSAMFNTVLGVLSAGPVTAPTAEMLPGGIGHEAVRKALTGRRVLVVDDSALNREVAGEFLNLVGVDVETAVDGLDALAKMEDRNYDAVLMDVHMPNMNGLETVRKIRTYHKWINLPVIALTAQARVEDRQASLDAGMTGHLTKPIDEMTLYHTLIKVLDGIAPAGLSKSTDFSRSGPAYDIDIESLAKRFGGSRERTERMISSFLRDFNGTPQQYDDLHAQQDWPQLAEQAHQIKGAAAYFGVSKFCEIAGVFERAIRDGDLAVMQQIAPQYRLHLVQCLDALSRAIAYPGLDSKKL